MELVEETPWQRRVTRWDFDPEIFYPDTMMVLNLTPGEKNEWELLSRDALRRRDQEGHQSLREKYKKVNKNIRQGAIFHRPLPIHSLGGINFDALLAQSRSYSNTASEMSIL